MLRKVLYIDLTRQESWVEERQELFESWMGGTGVGIRLLQEECPPGTDPLSTEAPIILSIGPLNGVFPVATKTAATFKSPLTGNLGESYAGGRLSLALRFAVHEAVVIRGRAERPSYISINDQEVRIKDATSIWGVDAQTMGIILRDREPGVGRRSVIRIGPAAKQLSDSPASWWTPTATSGGWDWMLCPNFYPPGRRSGICCIVSAAGMVTDENLAEMVKIYREKRG